MNEINSSQNLQQAFNSNSSDKEIIKAFPEDPLSLIKLFECIPHVNNKEIYHELFEKIEKLDSENKFNPIQIERITEITNAIYPSITNEHLKNRMIDFSFKRINDSNVFTLLEQAKKLNSVENIKKGLDFIEKNSSVKINIENLPLVSIKIDQSNVLDDKLSEQIKRLATIFGEDKIGIDFSPSASIGMDILEIFLEKHGQAVRVLDLRSLENQVDNKLSKKLIESCPNLYQLFIKSNIINSEGLDFSSLKALAVLDLAGCEALKALPVKLPDSLTSLNLTYCRALKALPVKLPDSLTSLDLTGCEALEALPVKLPDSLTSLDLSSCYVLEALPDKLPDSLTSLNLTYCQALEALPDKLPDSLTSLNLTYCQALEALPDKLPDSLTSLDLSCCQALKALPVKLPDSLTSLDLTGCEALEALPDKLPDSLTSLDLSSCRALKALPVKLPDSLTSLNLEGCALKALPVKLPDSLTSLNLSSCRALKALPAKLPDSLTSLDLTGCEALEALPAKLPDSLTSLNLSSCRALKALPDKLPDSLTSLDLSRCQALKALPAKLPDSLTSLNLTYCQALEALPDKLPDSLTSLHLTSGLKLTDDSRLKSLSAMFDTNFDQGMKLFKDFKINNVIFLKLIAKKLSKKPIMGDHDYKAILVESLRIKLENRDTSPTTLLILAQFAYDNRELLLLHDEHPLVQEAISIISIASIEGAKNPFSLFKKLKELSQKPIDFSPPRAMVEGSPVAINMAQLGTMARGSKIDRSELPKNVTRDAWEKMFLALELKVNDKPEAQATLKKLGTTWGAMSESVPYLSGLLDLRGADVSEPESQWRAVLSSILEKSNAPRDKFYFTEQEDELVTVLGGIGNCGPKKNEGIQTAYLLLNPKYQYQLKLPQWISAEEMEAKKARDKALDFVSKFIEGQPDKTAEVLSAALLSLVNNQQEFLVDTENITNREDITFQISSEALDKLKKNSGIISPLMSLERPEDDWTSVDLDVNTGTEINAESSEVLNKHGASALLKTFFEQGKIVAKEKATEFVSVIVKHFMDAQFVADNAIIKELTGVNDMPQGVHQLLYLRNLIGHLVGVSRGPVFDPHTAVLYDKLISSSREEALKVFFKHVTPERLVDEVVNAVNSNLEENKKLLAQSLGDEFWTEGENAGLTRLGAATLLTQQNFFKEA